MAYRGLVSAVVSLLVLSLVAGCASMERSEADRARAEAVEDTETLLEYLVYNDIAMMNHGPFSSDRLTVPGYRFTIYSGGELYIFEYPNGADALVDVGWLERERGIEAERHLYRKENLVALYYGEDPRVTRALNRSMGSQIQR